MIVDLVLAVIRPVITWVWTWLWDSLPEPPDWFVTGWGYFDTALDFAYDFDSWIPVSLMLLIAGLIVQVWFLSSVVMLVRMLVSYATLGGGAK